MNLLIKLFLLSVTLPASAATLCVGPSATGNGTGSDWDNQAAWSGTPSRGDTWYLADGSYASKTFSVAESGTTLITIKKATAGDHVTETGWSSGYGDGQAVLTGPQIFNSDYWVMDGNGSHTSASSVTNNYGIRVAHVNGASGVEGTGDHLTFRRIEVVGSGPDDADYTNDGFYFVTQIDSLTIQYCYIHEQGRCPLLGRGVSNMMFEHNWVARNEGYDTQHTEGVSIFNGTSNNDNTFRHNVWEDIEGTGIVVIGTGSGTCTGNKFYGNVVYWTSGYPLPGQYGAYISNGSFTSWTAETHSDSLYYNNTIIIPTSGGGPNFGVGNQGAGTGNAASNNLYVCNGTIGTRIAYDDGTAHDYNAYSGGNSEGEANQQTDASTNLFASFASYNFRLVAATAAGVTLASPYNSDPLGVTRGNDGIWDRGAYEYTNTTTYYAATNGSPSNDGLTTNTAWTLSHALSNAGTNTIVLLPGTYTGVWTMGSQGQTLRAQTKWTAILMSSTGTDPGLSIYPASRSNCVVDGLQIAGVAQEHGIYCLGTNATIKNCWIHHNGTNAQYHYGVYAPLLLGTTIEKCLIEFNGTSAQTDHGIYINGTNCTVRGNVFRHNAACGAQVYYYGAGNMTSNAWIYNNLSYSNGLQALAIGSISAPEYYVMNNTLIQGQGDACVYLNDSSGGGQNAKMMATNNVFIGSTVLTGTGASGNFYGDHNVTNATMGAAGFVDPSIGLYWLTSGSSARNVANTGVIPPVDFWGNAQSSVADAGAFQYNAVYAADTRTLDPSAAGGADYWSLLSVPSVTRVGAGHAVSLRLQ